MGLQDTTLKMSVLQENNINVKELFFYTIDDVQFLNVKFRPINFINAENCKNKILFSV